MNEITSIEQIADLLTKGFDNWRQFGDVSVKHQHELTLFNYTAKAQYANRWNFFERVSRGLILNNRTGEVVARPFDKFFNYGEHGRYPAARAHIKHIYEKMDGSLGISYRRNGHVHVATRGSFDSEQANWATGWLNLYHRDVRSIGDRWTLLFEIVYPGNRVVIDYGDERMLVLLAMRDRFTGEYADYFTQVIPTAELHGFSIPDYYDTPLSNLIINRAHKEVDVEGWVIEYSDGSRWKIKTDWYRELHRFVTNVSFNRVLEAVRSGSYDDLIRDIPDEYLDDVRQWHDAIEENVAKWEAEIRAAYENIKPASISKSDRKQFASDVHSRYKLWSSYLFALHDGKDIRHLILRDMKEIDND